MDKYNFNRLKELDLLTDDDKKILKHLTAIDNIFKKGNTKMRLFVLAGTMKCTTIIHDGEYEFDTFYNIPCDGGDPNDEELKQAYLLDDKLNELE